MFFLWSIAEEYIQIEQWRQTSTAGVEEGSLTAHGAHILEVFVNRETDGVAVVRVGVGEGEEVRRPNKEVPVERVETDT